MKYYFDTTGLVKIYHMESGSGSTTEYRGVAGSVIGMLLPGEVLRLK